MKIDVFLGVDLLSVSFYIYILAFGFMGLATASGLLTSICAVVTTL